MNSACCESNMLNKDIKLYIFISEIMHYIIAFRAIFRLNCESFTKKARKILIKYKVIYKKFTLFSRLKIRLLSC